MIKETKEEKAIKNYFKKRNRIILCVSTAVLLILLIDGLFFTKKNKENKNNNNIEEVVNNSEKEDKEIDNNKEEENNQLISNNNNEEDKKVTENKSEDKNKEKEEVSSKPSRINLRLIIFIFVIIIIAVIIFIIAILIFKKIKFEKSKEDFAKENFCPTFFLIGLPQCQDLKNVEINNVKEDAECFFEILAKLVFSNFEKDIEGIKEIKISLNNYINNENNDVFNNNILEINFMNIINKINKFAFCNTNNETAHKILQGQKEFQEEAKLYGKYEKENKKIKEKYSNYIEFCSYLYSYLIYYLLETFTSKHKDKEITITAINENNLDEEKVNFETHFVSKSTHFMITNDYDQADFKIMEQTLKELLPRLNNQKSLEHNKLF